MENKEILEKARLKPDQVGEMEKTKINKSCWIANVVAVTVAITLMIIEGALGHFSAIYAIGAVCYGWASVFYFMQFFVAKRRYVGIMIGAVLHGVAFVAMITLYILINVGVI